MEPQNVCCSLRLGIYILYPVVAGETELILTCVVPIAELGQKCLEAGSILKYEPLNSCITVHSV